jgi:hypothetical protein
MLGLELRAYTLSHTTSPFLFWHLCIIYVFMWQNWSLNSGPHLMLARQVLYHLSHSISPFLC